MGGRGHIALGPYPAATPQSPAEDEDRFMFHRRLKMLLVVVFATASLVASNGTAAATSTTDPEVKDHGCPSGFVCIYPEGQPYTEGDPEAMFQSYGHHNLSGQYGTHDVMNNQWADEGEEAPAFLNSGYDGGGEVIREIGHGGQVTRVSLTPVNSITLAAPSPRR